LSERLDLSLKQRSGGANGQASSGVRVEEYLPQGHSAATPQQKRKGRDHHEGHEEYERRNSKFIKKFYPNFVSFVIFVVNEIS
jgi:hypothetical protein